MSLLPIIHYWRPNAGLISYTGEIRFPMFYQLYYESVSIKPELIKVFDELEKLATVTLDIEKYVKVCNRLKNHFLLEGLDKLHNLISLLKIQDDFFLLGNIGQFNSDFFNVFSLEPNTYKYTGINPFLLTSFDSWPLPRLFLLYLISVTPHILSDVHRTKLIEIRKQVNELKNTYRKNNKLKNSDGSLELLLSLKNELNYLLSDLNEIKKLIKSFKSYILDNPEIHERSIVVAPEGVNLKTNLIKSKIQATYLHTLNEEFDLRSKDTEEFVDEIKMDLKFLEERIEPLQQQLTRNSNSKLGKIMLILSIVTGFFATIVGMDVINRWSNP